VAGQVALAREGQVEIGRTLDRRVAATKAMLTAARFDPEPAGPQAWVVPARQRVTDLACTLRTGGPPGTWGPNVPA
jgi:hypothetical protein